MPSPPTTDVSRYWNRLLAKYATADDGKATFQLLTTATLFALTWYLMLVSLRGPYWVTLLLALPAAGLHARLFIFQHDCGHGSFFRSSRANNIVGTLIGVLTLTPYWYWRRTHSIHHATQGNLDRREWGELDTLTVREYVALSSWGRLGYRTYRHPFVLFVLGGLYMFVLRHRFPFGIPASWKKEWSSVMVTNLAIAAVVVLAWQTIGLERFLLVHAPIVLLVGCVGIWLFYIQHQFEDTYWRREPEWNFHRAAMAGASYYDLPRILHWFTGNIGLHHIHHLSSRIPNYKLQACLREVPETRHATRLTLWSSLRCARLRLWDEERKRLVGFGDLG
ncbi:MAG: fatty acid desaturase [Planctomycetota bacterium]